MVAAAQWLRIKVFSMEVSGSNTGIEGLYFTLSYNFYLW